MNITWSIVRTLLGAGICLAAFGQSVDYGDARPHRGGGGARMNTHIRPPVYHGGGANHPVGPRNYHYHSDHWQRNGNYYGRWVAGAVATTAVVATVGAVVYSLPPACEVLYSGGVKYWACGSTYYQARYEGPDVVYVVVSRP